MPKGGDLLNYQRTTTFIDVLQDEYLLKQWGNRNVAWGMSQRNDLRLAAAACEPDSHDLQTIEDKRELNDIVAKANEVAGHKIKAIVGSSLHKLTHQMDRGNEWPGSPRSVVRRPNSPMRDRLLASNPARGVKLPKRPPRRNVYLTAGQLDTLADESGRYRSLVLLLGVGGLRWGEAAALRVGDVDFLRRRIELHRNAVRWAPSSSSAR